MSHRSRLQTDEMNKSITEVNDKCLKCFLSSSPRHESIKFIFRLSDNIVDCSFDDNSFLRGEYFLLNKLAQVVAPKNKKREDC